MRILATSDLRGNGNQMSWILRASDSAHLLLLAGDLLAGGVGKSDLIRWLERIQCPVAIASGQSDLDACGYEWLYSLRTPRRAIDDVDVFGDVPLAMLPAKYERQAWEAEALRSCSLAAKIARAQQRHGRFIAVAQSIPTAATALRSVLLGSLVITASGSSDSRAIHSISQTDHRIPNHIWFDWSTGHGTLAVRWPGTNLMQPAKFRF